MADLRGIAAAGLDGVLVDQNYRKNQFPITKLGTKYLAWFSIRFADTSLGEEGGDNEKVSKILDVIQNLVEIYYVSTPTISDTQGRFAFAAGIDARADFIDGDGYSPEAAALAEKITLFLQGRADELPDYDAKNASAYPPAITETDGETEVPDEDILCEYRVMVGLTLLAPSVP
jgi:hypothetical protein